MSSEVEQKRLLINLVLSNVRIEGEKVLYDAQKPFDLILDATDCKQWRGLVDAFRNFSIELGVGLEWLKRDGSSFGIKVCY